MQLSILRGTLRVPLLLASLPFSTIAMSTKMIIDSHLHVWASSQEASSGFPYAEGQDPPESLKDAAATSRLLEKMQENGVDGALIVQPINHKFDHSYVISAMKKHPDRFKGMLLHDPSLSSEQAVSTLEDLALKGFVGVRFNPYLWPKEGESKWKSMSSPSEGGLAVYKRCGELKMPVGVMCFQGLQLHYDDIIALLKSSPETTLILDHFGFTSFTPEGDKAFQQLLELAEYPQVVVKISALFRLNDVAPYAKVKQDRFEPLLKTFGPDRLMFGTDFPFVLEQKSDYGGTKDLVSSWIEDESAKEQIMGGTATRCFGAWGFKSVV
jgi:predicted TIM-barrel fold metal-dependent hydrolase